MKERLDLLVSRLFGYGREFSKELIESGAVTVNGKPAVKPGAKFSEDDVITCEPPEKRFVGRGGYKLDYALSRFNCDISGRVCIDVGASTGGFTDCMLQRGAARVYAVENGTGQLADALLADPRVISMERTDIRSGLSICEAIGFAAVDVSFISLTKVMPYVAPLLATQSEGVCLVKPQYEAGRVHLSKKGIVKDAAIRAKAVETIKEHLRGLGLKIEGSVQSPIAGGDGNIEYLLYFRQ